MEGIKRLRRPYLFIFSAPHNPNNFTVLASADASETGMYAIAGVGGCYPDETYGLRLFADSLGPNPQLVHPKNKNYDQGQDQYQIHIDSKYVSKWPATDDVNVPLFWMDIEGIVY